MAAEIRAIRPEDFVQKCVAFSTAMPRILAGSRGEAVRRWQVLMQKAMAPAPGAPQMPMLPLDGVFGHLTQAYTMAFQRKVKLPPDGVVGPKTWAAALVAPCYAAAVAAQRRGPRGAAEALMQLKREVDLMRAEAARSATAAHGVGALDLSFSMVDPKSMILGVVLGVAAGAVLFRKK